MWRIILAGIATILLASCDHVFDYHPYAAKLSSKYEDINSKNLKRIMELDQTKDTIRFIWLGDTQRWYDETHDFVKAVNQRDDIDFVVHGGDISDFGLRDEFCKMHDILSKLNVPYVAIIGNHDVLGLGSSIYNVIYGEPNFSFVFRGVKFLCLNTNALEYDYSTPVPDFDFLIDELKDSVNQYDRTIAMMHAQPGDIVFNNNVKYVFHEFLKSFPHLMFCTHAHAHKLMQNDFFNDGIIYYGADAIKGKNYMLFTVTKEGYQYEVVYF